MEESKRYSLTAELREQPVYKIVQHLSKSKQCVYVFVGQTTPTVLKALKAQKRTAHEEELLSVSFGKNYRNKLALGFVGERFYIDQTIYHDDTIYTLLSKLRHYLKLDITSIDQLYLWISVKATNAISVSNYFLNAIYSEKTLAQKSELASLFYYYTGKKIKLEAGAGEKLVNKLEAHQFLAHQKYKSIQEPLLFKYCVNNNFVYFPVNPFAASEFDSTTFLTGVDKLYEHGRLLESFIIENNIINLITFKKYESIFGDDNSKLYFPFSGQFKSQTPEMVSENDKQMANYHTQLVDHMHAEGFFNYMYLKVNEFTSVEEEVLSVQDLFAKLKPNYAIPFIKYITSTNTEYKLYKPAITSDLLDTDIGASKISPEQLSDWTKQDLVRFGKSVHAILVLKAFIGMNNNYVTIIIHTNGMYDVKLNYAMSDRVSFARVTEHLKIVNDLMKETLPARHYMPIDLSSWMKGQDETNTRTVKMMTNGIITSTHKLLPISAIEKAVRALPQLFSVVGSKNGILHLLYKRIDNYTKQDNIMIFIAKNFTAGKPAIIEKLKDNFSLTFEEASDQYDKWHTKNKVANLKLGAKVYFKQNLNDFVSVKLQPSGIGYKYGVNGVTSLLHHRRIVRGLEVVINMAETGTKGTAASAKKANYSVADEIIEVIEDESGSSDDDDDDNKNDDYDAFNKQAWDQMFVDEDMEEATEDTLTLWQMKENMECPTAQSKKAAKTKEPKVKKVILKRGGAKADDSKEPKKYSYILSQLYAADKTLFLFKSRGNYAKSCQDVSKRQPIVLKKNELDYINHCFPDALQNHINTGSEPHLEAKNHYVCPVVWCPKSRVALTKKQFEEEYGGRCPFPGIEEEPILFESSFFKRDTRYAGYLDPSKHPDSTESKPLNLPCCFNLPETTEKGNDKYIKAYSFPLPKGRFGLLPTSLAAIFKDKFCGGKTGSTGLMNNRTDCYLRTGVNLTKHSYLTCLAQLLENPSLKTEQEILNVIVNRLKISTFLLIDNGLLCKKFINDIWHPTNITLFSQFRAWFKEQQEYIVSFNLEQVAQELEQNSDYSSKLVYKQEIKREFMIYSSFQNFIKYLKNDNVAKSHDLLNTLMNMQLSWLNKQGYNIVVFEKNSPIRIKAKEEDDEDGKKKRNSRITIAPENEAEANGVFLSCPYSGNLKELFRKEKSTIMLIKSGKYYEPIVHIKMQKTNLMQTTHHKYKESPDVYRILNYYLDACGTKVKSNGALAIFNAIESLGKKVETQVLNYEFQLIAFYTKDKFLVPLKAPEQVLQSRGTSYAFIDSCTKRFKFPNSESDVKTFLRKLNELLQTDYFHIKKSNGYKLELNDTIVDVPLTTIHDHMMEYYNDDLQIFIDDQIDDDRIEHMKQEQHDENVYMAFRNEMVHIMNYDVEMMQDLLFLRHPANPIPLRKRREMLLNKLKPLLYRFVEEQSIRKYNESMTAAFQERPCSTIGKRNDCNNQCSWVVDMRPDGKKKKIVASHCKLRVRKGDKMLLLEKVVDDLLNPTSQLKMAKQVRDAREYDDVLMFNDRDIDDGDFEKLVAQLENPKMYDFEHHVELIDQQKLKLIDKKIENKFKGAIVKNSDEQEGIDVMLPHEWRKSLKEFRIVRTDETEYKEKYNRDFIYLLFAKINNRVNSQSKMSPEELKRLVTERTVAEIKRNYDKVKPSLMYNDYIRTKKKDPSQEQMIKLISSEEYYPSEFELKMIGKIIKVNVVIISRKIEKHNDKMRCIGLDPSSDYYVMLHQPTDSSLKYDLFELITKNGSSILQIADFGELSNIVKNKCKIFKIKAT